MSRRYTLGKIVLPDNTKRDRRKRDGYQEAMMEYLAGLTGKQKAQALL